MKRPSEWIYRYSTPIVLGWLLALLLAGGYAGRLHEVLAGPGLTVRGSEERVEKLRREDEGVSGEPLAALFESLVPASEDRFEASVEAALAKLPAIAGLVRIEKQEPRAEEERSRYRAVLFSFRQEEHELGPALNQLRSWAAGMNETGVYRISITGQAAVQQDVNESSRLDIRQAERIGLPIAFAILCLSLRGVLPALLPIAAGMASVVLAMAILHGVGTRVELSVFVQSVVPMVGLALCIDFALLLVSRYREECRRHSAREALDRTMRTAGRSIVLSTLCVLVGLGSTLWIRLPVFNSVALSAMIVLLVAAAASLTLVPALLIRMDASVIGRGAGASPLSRFWSAWGAWALKRPLRLALFGSVLFLLCVVPVLRMDVVIPDETSLPANNESRAASGRIHDFFLPPGATFIKIVAQSRHAALDEKELSELKRLYRTLEQDARVLFASAPSLNGEGNRAWLDVWIGARAESGDDAAWVRELQQAPYELDFYLAGKPVERQEILSEVTRGIKKAIPTLLLTNYFLLLAAFRSYIIPLKAVLMNALTIAAAFGIVTLVFQGGLLGMPQEGIAVVVPVFVFGLAFGISMDYGVFLLTRIAENYRRTGDNDRAVLEGLAATGPMITSAAAIMTAVCLPFAWGDVAGVRQLGVGLTAAVLLDATLVRMLLVPTWMKLLGRWNWFF